MKVSAMTWLKIGCGFIVLSIALQAATLFLPSLTFALNLAGYIIAAISVPFTIVQAYSSAREQQKKDLYLYGLTPEGRQMRALNQLRASMTKDSPQQTTP